MHISVRDSRSWLWFCTLGFLSNLLITYQWLPFLAFFTEVDICNAHTIFVVFLWKTQLKSYWRAYQSKASKHWCIYCLTRRHLVRRKQMGVVHYFHLLSRVTMIIHMIHMIHSHDTYDTCSDLIRCAIVYNNWLVILLRRCHKNTYQSVHFDSVAPLQWADKEMCLWPGNPYI